MISNTVHDTDTDRHITGECDLIYYKHFKSALIHLSITRRNFWQYQVFRYTLAPFYGLFMW